MPASKRPRSPAGRQARGPAAGAAKQEGRPAPPRRGARSPSRPTPARGEGHAPLRVRAAEIFSRLHREYPDAHCELDHANPFQLLAATILSAQCTDQRVNTVTPALFARYPTPRAFADARREDVEAIIKPTGFYRNKARNLIGMATALVERFGGEIPRDIDALVTIPGVGRKTANVILGDAFGIAAGVVVDTHVGRLSRRLGLTKETDPVKVERALTDIFPREHWTLLAHLLIFHGRRVCYARRPQCEHCVLHDICPSSLV